MEEALLWCVWLLSVGMLGIYIRWRANWIRLAITTYSSIMWSHLEHSLFLKDLNSCDIMTQSIQVNSPRGLLKAKRNSPSFNWCLGRGNQQTKILLNWCGMNLTKKSELNQPQEQFTSGNSCRKAEQNYLQSTSHLW